MRARAQLSERGRQRAREITTGRRNCICKLRPSSVVTCRHKCIYMNVLSALSKHTVLQKQALRQTQTAEPNSGEVLSGFSVNYKCKKREPGIAGFLRRESYSVLRQDA